jgi:hypothetical protein
MVFPLLHQFRSVSSVRSCDRFYHGKKFLTAPTVISLAPNNPHADKESNHHDPSSTLSPRVGRAATEAEEAKSPRAADGVASSAGITATVRKSDHGFRKLNTLALFSVPLLLVTPLHAAVAPQAF